MNRQAWSNVNPNPSSIAVSRAVILFIAFRAKGAGVPSTASASARKRSCIGCSLLRQPGFTALRCSGFVADSPCTSCCRSALSRCRYQISVVSEACPPGNSAFFRTGVPCSGRGAFVDLQADIMPAHRDRLQPLSHLQGVAFLSHHLPGRVPAATGRWCRRDG